MFSMPIYQGVNIRAATAKKISSLLMNFHRVFFINQSFTPVTLMENRSKHRCVFAAAMIIFHDLFIR